MSEDPYEGHLQRAEESLRAGDPMRAGQIWQAILKRVPDHPIARQGLIRVKQALEAASAPAPAAVSAEELATMLRQASQLWDLGVPEDAVAKWEAVLAIDPGNAEAQAFIAMVRKEQAEEAAKPPKPAPPPAPVHPEEMTSTIPAMVQEGEDPRVVQGEHLLTLNRYEEAIYAFQQALAHQPDHARALAGLARAQAAVRPPQELVQAPPRPVALPASLTTTPARRLGLDLPAPLRELLAHPWVHSPTVWGVALASLLIVGIGISYWRQAAKDRQLRADVTQAIQEALAPVLRASVIIDLNETSASILAEGKSALGEDPLLAYHRAKEVLRRSPQDAPAAQLLETARTALAKVGSVPEGSWEAKVREGDLDSALALLLAQLRMNPDDPILLRKTASLLGSRAQLQALKGNLGTARESLQKARALFPEDPAWNARLKLLDHIQSQPKAEQSGWIALLG